MQFDQPNEPQPGPIVWSRRQRASYWIASCVLCGVVALCLPIRQITLAGSLLRGSIGMYGYGTPLEEEANSVREPVIVANSFLPVTPARSTTSTPGISSLRSNLRSVPEPPR